MARAPLVTAHRLLSAREFRWMSWKNGQGRSAEIATWPAGSHDDFAWRVAIADIERDVPFSAYPGYDRTIVLLDGGGVVLTHDGIAVELGSHDEPYRFPGEATVECRVVGSPVRAFNLMLRRGRAQGTLVVADAGSAIGGPFRFGVCYASSGASECLLPGHAPIGVAPGSALVIDGGAPVASMHVNPADGGAVAIVAALDAHD